MWKTRTWVIGIALCYLILPQHGHSRPDADEFKPLIQKFFAVYAKEDLNGLMALWSNYAPDHWDWAWFRRNARQRFAAADYAFAHFTFVRPPQVDGNHARLLVAVDRTEVNARTKKRTTQQVTHVFVLAKESGAWRVSRLYPAAMEDLARALAAAKTEKERRTLLASKEKSATDGLVRALLVEGERQRQQKRYAQALALAQLARAVAERVNDKDGWAQALAGIGDTFASWGKPYDALPAYEKSVKALEAEAQRRQHAGAPLESSRLLICTARILQDKGITYKEVLYNYPQALMEFQRMLAVAQRSGDRGVIALAFNNIGGIHVEFKAAQGIQEMEKAVRMLEECVAQQPKDERTRTRYLVVLNHLAAAYKQLGLYYDSLERYEKSLKISRETKDKVGEAGALWGMGTVHNDRREYDKAEMCAKQSLAAAYAVKPEPHWGWVVSGWGDLWDVYLKQGKYDEALRCAQEVLKVGQQTHQGGWEAMALQRMTYVYMRRGDKTQACEYIQKTLQKAKASASLSAVPHVLRGDLYRLKQQWDRAAEAYQKAIDEGAKHHSWALDPLATFISDADSYHNFAACQIRLKRTAAALRTTELTKARLLTELLRAGRVDITKDMTAEEKRTERKLDEAIRNVNTQLSGLLSQSRPDAQLVKALKARLKTARDEYDSFHLKLYLNHPELEAQRAETKPVTLDRISQLLPDNQTAFLEYLIGEEESYLFVLTRQSNKKSEIRNPKSEISLSVYRLDVKRDQLIQWVSELRSDIASRRKSPPQAQTLYKLLVAPAEKALEGKTAIGIVPDEALWDLPFQALQDKSGHYLVEKHAVFYAPSLTALDAMNHLVIRRRAQPPNHPTTQPPILLAMAHPLFDSTRKFELTLRGIDNYAELPNTEKEVRSIEASFGKAAKVYTRSEATEERAKQEMRRYRILHFATHGVFDPNQPMYSGILLAKGRSEDGFLEAREIANMDLNADLAVLSACDTARGAVQEGEGILGLSWALFVAGCPSSVLTQWKVADDSTAELMKQFYAHLKQGKSKAAALQAAQLSLLRPNPKSKIRNPKWTHPFYWAPFVLIGDGRTSPRP